MTGNEPRYAPTANSIAKGKSSPSWHCESSSSTLMTSVFLVEIVGFPVETKIVDTVKKRRELNQKIVHLTTISTEPKILWELGLQKLKTCSLYHENIFIQKVKVISTQVLNNFFSASDIMEAVRDRFHFYGINYKGCMIQVVLL